MYQEEKWGGAGVREGREIIKEGGKETKKSLLFALEPTAIKHSRLSLSSIFVHL